MDPRDYQVPGLGRLAPDRGSLGDELDDADGSLIWGDDPRSDDYLEQTPETGHFPHDA
jgi:hypothetical protein